jgi:hypothetical protein
VLIQEHNQLSLQAVEIGLQNFCFHADRDWGAYRLVSLFPDDGAKLLLKR